MDLFVRAGRNDNLVIEELLAPATAGLHMGRRVPMRGLVIDAPTAIAVPAYREAAEAAGLPLLIDPLTHLFQDEQEEDNPWAALDYAHSEQAKASDFSNGPVLDELIERTMSFQLAHGASVLIPPYFHAKSPDDPWFEVQLAVLRRTGAYLTAEGINVPVAPIFAGSLQRFGKQASWAYGLDKFLRHVDRLNVRYVLVCA